ncbi:MAG: apolipoprotein N-acyltransferase [Rhodothermales bacterium]
MQHTPYLGAAVSGVFMGLSFPPFPLGFLAWFALAPLLIRLSGGISWREVVAESTTASFIMIVLAGYWVVMHPVASARNASLAGLVALSLTASIPFWLFGIGTGRKPMAMRFGLFFGVSAIVEYAQFHTEIGFPWLIPGHTQATVFPINQLAAYVGAPGLSTWVLLCNALVVTAVLSRTRPSRIRAWSALALFIMASITLGYHRSRIERAVTGKFEVLAVQPALSPASWSNIWDEARPDTLIQLTRTANGPRPDLVIWPETALPVLRSRNRPSAGYTRLKSFIDSLEAPILTGAVVKETSAETGDETYYNSAVIISPFVGITGRYDKRILVPFAERVPYVDRYPWLRSLAVASSGATGYGAGSSPGRLSLRAVDLGIMICFESAFGRAARDADPEQVAFYVVLAQDGWWGETAGYRQHWAFTRLRAIETGRAVVQVTVTGTSGLIFPDGETEGETEWMARTTRLLSVPKFTGTTPYAAVGDLPVLGFGLLLLLSGLVVQMRVSK